MQLQQAVLLPVDQALYTMPALLISEDAIIIKQYEEWCNSLYRFLLFGQASYLTTTN